MPSTALANAPNVRFVYNLHYVEVGVRVSTADFIKNGRDRLVVVSAAEYDRLKRRNRRVVRAEDLSDQQLGLIAEAKVPAEYGHLDAELEDWKP